MKQLQLAILSTPLLLAGAPALAATATDTFQVSATVLDACSVTAGDLAFGNVDLLSGTDVDATSSIEVTCSTGTAYDVGIGPGTADGATTSSRQMGDGDTGALDYALYSDGTRDTNWGDVVDTDTVAGTGDGGVQTLTVFGRVPSGQTGVAAGAYTDTVTVTVTY